MGRHQGVPAGCARRTTKSDVSELERNHWIHDRGYCPRHDCLDILGIDRSYPGAPHREDHLSMAEATTKTKNWYVVHTYAGFEGRVKTSILDRAKEMGLQETIGDVLVPTER